MPRRVAKALSWRFQRLAEFVERRRKALLILTYHRLFSRILDTPFDDEVFAGMSQEYFARQLAWLKKNTDVLNEAELLRGVRRPAALPRRGVVITFDDGYIDNYTLAYPVLRQLQLPAIFFVPTQALTERRLGWWDIVNYLVKHARRTSLSLEGADYPLSTPEDRKRLIELLIERFKTLPADQTGGLLADLSRGLETDFPPSGLEDAEIMTFAQLREMLKGGMAVGSHTHTHRVLATLDPAEQQAEIVESKRILEEGLGVPVRSLAYPVGRRDSFGETAKRLARQAGYELAFSYYSGCNRPGRLDPFDLRRTSKRAPFETFVYAMVYPGQILKPAT